MFLKKNRTENPSQPIDVQPDSPTRSPSLAFLLDMLKEKGFLKINIDDVVDDHDRNLNPKNIDILDT